MENRVKQTSDLCRTYNCALTGPEETKLQQWLTSADDWALFRINPYRIADAFGIEQGHVLNFFVAGVRTGLFDLQWNVVCPGCGGVEFSHQSIADLNHRKFVCTVCTVGIPPELDDQVEASFTLNTGIKKLAIDPFGSLQDYLRFFFSENYRHSDQFRNFFAENTRGFLVVRPGQSQPVQLPADPGGCYRVISMSMHADAVIQMADDVPQAPTSVELRIGRDGFSQKTLTAGSGPVTLNVTNGSDHPVAMTLLKFDAEKVMHIMATWPHRKQRFLTAKELISRQLYRDLFRSQELPKDFNLNIRSLTLLFTDLKGSTELYENSGDLSAYHVVQEHFSILKQAVRECSGAIVKTMGDAIMATFPDPLSAFQAALMILSRTTGFWEKHNVPTMGIKIGLHEGAALAINDEGRIDYFGQTVNTAARIQGQANAGEIVFSDGIYQESAIKKLLRDEGCNLELENVSLKGVKHPVPVYRLHFRA